MTVHSRLGPELKLENSRLQASSLWPTWEGRREACTATSRERTCPGVPNPACSLECPCGSLELLAWACPSWPRYMTTKAQDHRSRSMSLTAGNAHAAARSSGLLHGLSTSKPWIMQSHFVVILSLYLGHEVQAHASSSGPGLAPHGPGMQALGLSFGLSIPGSWLLTAGHAHAAAWSWQAPGMRSPLMAYVKSNETSILSLCDSGLICWKPGTPMRQLGIPGC